MGTNLHICILLAGSVLAKEPELPLCPTNLQYLPQNLPMHCRMPVNGNPPPFPMFPGSAPGKPQENTQSVPVPPMPAFPKPPGFPPGAIPGFPPGYPMPPGMPMPMPMPIQMAGPPQTKLPVIVMPFYSPDPTYKGPAPNLRPDNPENRRPHKKKRERRKRRRPYKSDESDTDTDTDDTDDSADSEADDGYWRSGRRTMNAPKRRRRKNSRRKQMLTPILQYVTKDGYVIYEKQISKGEAKDWLGKGKANEEDNPMQEPDTPKPHSAEDDDVPVAEVTTRGPPGPSKMKVKVQKTTDIQRHHHHKPKYNAEPHPEKE